MNETLTAPGSFWPGGCAMEICEGAEPWRGMVKQAMPSDAESGYGLRRLNAGKSPALGDAAAATASPRAGDFPAFNLRNPYPDSASEGMACFTIPRHGSAPSQIS